MSVTLIPNDYYIKRVRTPSGTTLTYMHINNECWYIYKLSRGWYYRQSFATSTKSTGTTTMSVARGPYKTQRDAIIAILM